MNLQEEWRVDNVNDVEGRKKACKLLLLSTAFNRDLASVCQLSYANSTEQDCIDQIVDVDTVATVFAEQYGHMSFSFCLHQLTLFGELLHSSTNLCRVASEIGELKRTDPQNRHVKQYLQCDLTLQARQSFYQELAYACRDHSFVDQMEYTFNEKYGLLPQ